MQEARTPIDAVIFDYGEVICGSDVEDWARMVQVSGVTRSVFDDAYWCYRLEYDRGMTPEDYWSQVAQHVGTQFSSEKVSDLIEADARHWSHVRQPMLDWIERLKNHGLRLGLISNMPHGIAVFMRRTMHWLKDFDSIVFSCDLEICKPDAEIYLHSLRDLGVEPQRSLFLDDKHENIEGAKAVGMHGLVFDSFDGLQPRLTAYNLPA
jgi:putative hydrolase of the HAD superfamily